MNWDDYFMEMALLASKRSSCLRRNIGAVAAKNNRILATGYNSMISHAKHCKTCIRDEMGIPSGEKHEFCKALHAEQNLIIQCAIHGVSMKHSIVYVTNKPCSICFKMLANTMVDKIVFKNYYPDSFTDILMRDSGYFFRKDNIIERRI